MIFFHDGFVTFPGISPDCSADDKQFLIERHEGFVAFLGADVYRRIMGLNLSCIQ